jgi:hypothetical protein
VERRPPDARGHGRAVGRARPPARRKGGPLKGLLLTRARF